MNIDLINTANSPPRVAQPEAGNTPRLSKNQNNSPVAASKVAKPDTQAAKAPDLRDVEKAVEKLTDFVSSKQADINFSIDESSGVRVVKIMDRDSKEVIRQIPSEEAVALAQVLDKLQGLLIKEKA